MPVTYAIFFWGYCAIHFATPNALSYIHILNGISFLFSSFFSFFLPLFSLFFPSFSLLFFHLCNMFSSGETLIPLWPGPGEYMVHRTHFEVTVIYFTAVVIVGLGCLVVAIPSIRWPAHRCPRCVPARCWTWAWPMPPLHPPSASCAYLSILARDHLPDKHKEARTVTQRIRSIIQSVALSTTKYNYQMYRTVAHFMRTQQPSTNFTFVGLWPMVTLSYLNNYFSHFLT